MYINKPLIKVERVRMPSRATNQTPSGQKKKSRKAVSTYSTSSVNLKISRPIGQNFWRTATKKSKEPKNIGYRFKMMKPSSTAKGCLINSTRQKKKNSRRYEDSSKSRSKLFKNTSRFVSLKRSKEHRRSKLSKPRSRSSKERSRIMERKSRGSTTFEKRSKTTHGRSKMQLWDSKLPNKRATSKRVSTSRPNKSKWTF